MPKKVERIRLEHKGEAFDLWVVFLPGITHIIFDGEKAGAGYIDFAEAAIKKWAMEFEEEAIGLILFEEKSERITPLVYVKNTDSLYWERGCGSGTAAVGAYMSCRLGESVKIPVKQPGGIITTETTFEDKEIKQLKITGKVFFEKEGIFDYEE